MDMNGYTYDAKFEGNVLVLGQTACGKTTFIQNLGKNKLFGDIKDVIWLTKIVLSKQREENIRSSFNVPVNFYYLQNVSEFETLIENFQRKKYNVKEDNLIGESNIFDRVIIMDDVSGLAHKYNEFRNYLTVARKFNFTAVYVFHTLANEYLKQKCLIYFQDQFKFLKFLKYLQLIAKDTLMSIFR